MKYMIRIAFNGESFYGTQRQKKERTIQGVFEECLSSLYDTEIAVTICSRLDRGVNALDYALTFTPVDNRISISHLKYYLTRYFKPEILIKNVIEVDDSFSPRYDCSKKTYCYLIQKSSAFNPLLKNISYITKKDIDVDKIKECISLFKGTHDFRRFATPEGDENTILKIDSVSVKEKHGMIYLRFTSKAFLRYQVRFMVGAIVTYAFNKGTLDQIKELLDGKDNDFPKNKAPANGLFLEKIDYPTL